MFRISKGSVEASFQALVLSQSAKAIEDAGNPDTDKGVHAARRRVKKLRSAYRLVRPVFKRFRAEDAVARDAARGLSGSRDALVAQHTLDKLIAGAEGSAELFAPARTLLEHKAQAHSDPLEALRHFTAVMRALQARAPSFTLAEEGWQAIAPGLKATYSATQRRMRHAAKSNDPLAFHEFRKAAKHHAAQLRLLHDLAPDLLPAVAAVADHLGEALGRHHDLAVLRDMLGHSEAYRSAEERARAEAIFAEALAAEAVTALGLGRQLLAERPKDMLRRMHRYWKD